MGVAFMFHGWPKIQNPMGWWTGEPPVPGIFQALAALAEFGGGMALIVGLLTRLASLGIARTWSWHSPWFTCRTATRSWASRGAVPTNARRVPGLRRRVPAPGAGTLLGRCLGVQSTTRKPRPKTQDLRPKPQDLERKEDCKLQIANCELRIANCKMTDWPGRLHQFSCSPAKGPWYSTVPLRFKGGLPVPASSEAESAAKFCEARARPLTIMAS